MPKVAKIPHSQVHWTLGQHKYHLMESPHCLDARKAAENDAFVTDSIKPIVEISPEQFCRKCRIDAWNDPDFTLPEKQSVERADARY